MKMAAYDLLDFGEGRKLESLGGYLIDRPSPAAVGSRRQSKRWLHADARYDETARQWMFAKRWPADAVIDCGAFGMPVQPTPYGHIGLFPEQRSNWRWLADQVVKQRAALPWPAEQEPPPVQCLNLFGYTGASSIALAMAGGRVAHVDAAKPNVAAARVAATGMAVDQSIRFLVDDARKFVAREGRRGHCFQTIALDPPAYGHGPAGKAWRLERDLWPLLEDCLTLLRGPHVALLVTGHSEQVDHNAVARWLRQSISPRPRIDARRVGLLDAAKRTLDCGFLVRATWSA